MAITNIYLQIGNTRKSWCIWNYRFVCSQSKIIPRCIGWRTFSWAAIRSHASKGYYLIKHSWFICILTLKFIHPLLSRGLTSKGKLFMPIAKLTWKPSAKTPSILTLLIKLKRFHIPYLNINPIYSNFCMCWICLSPIKWSKWSFK